MRAEGFTLIELMIALAIINILALIGYGKLSQALDASRDATTRGNLGILREAIAAYYSVNEGQYPAFAPPYGEPAAYGNVLSNALVPNFLSKIPPTIESGNHHPPSSEVFQVWNQTGSEDYEAAGYGAGWKYDANPFDIGVYPGVPGFGSIKVLCTHTDSKGNNWSVY